jgi:hypothetical protein
MFPSANRFLLRLIFPFAVFGAVWIGNQVSAQVAKPPPPSGATRQLALTKAKDAFKDEIAAARRSGHPNEIASRLLKVGTDERTDLDARWALLTLARDAAIEARNLGIAMAAIDQLAQTHDIEPLKEKVDGAIAITPLLRGDYHRDEFVKAAEYLMNQAVAADAYDHATRVADLALTAARMRPDAGAVKRVNVEIQQIKEAQAASAAATAGSITLLQTPDDANANLRLGRFRCFYKGDWAGGIPPLAKGSDKSLAELARQDLAGATTTDQCIALGDAWWAASERLAGLPRANAMRRAARWYRQAWLALPRGLVRDQVARRLDATSLLRDRPLLP